MSDSSSRRIDTVPEHALPWLLVTARNVSSNQLRGRERRTRVLASLQHAAASKIAENQPATVIDRMQMAAALGALSERDREAITLVTWMDLPDDEAAQAMGCSRRTFAVRLHRARQRLRKALTAEPGQLDQDSQPLPSSRVK